MPPLDPFTGDRVLYNSQAQTIYTRGVNAKDNVGVVGNFFTQCHTDEKCSNDHAVSLNVNLCADIGALVK